MYILYVVDKNKQIRNILQAMESPPTKTAHAHFLDVAY